jgi:hypothetical protein
MQIKYYDLNVYPLLIFLDFRGLPAVAPYNPVEFHRNFERKYYPQIMDQRGREATSKETQRTSFLLTLHFYLEHGSSEFCRNICELRHCMMSHSKSQ